MLMLNKNSMTFLKVSIYIKVKEKVSIIVLQLLLFINLCT